MVYAADMNCYNMGVCRRRDVQVATGLLAVWLARQDQTDVLVMAYLSATNAAHALDHWTGLRWPVTHGGKYAHLVLPGQVVPYALETLALQAAADLLQQLRKDPDRAAVLSPASCTEYTRWTPTTRAH